MKIHYLQHVPFETPGEILTWAKERNYPVEGTMMFNNENLPNLGEFDLLFVMGGPMGVHDEKQYPWLKEEKSFLKQAIESGKTIVGICLGAQLLAHVLGASVRKNIVKEIGWFPVSLTPIGWELPLFRNLPATFDAFHWHGDTFEIPENGLQIASSEACANQAFIAEDRLIGLQFHLEIGRNGVERLVRHCGNELLEGGEYVQGPEVILEEGRNYGSMKTILFQLLDQVASTVKAKN